MKMNKISPFFARISIPFARFSLFVVFFWFGFLKTIGESPASPLVQVLFQKTIPFMSFETFIILFGVFECVIGILFLIRGAEVPALILLVLHQITTTMPLILLGTVTWSQFMVPTMEGQYIIKNLLLLSAAFIVFAGNSERAKFRS